ncbi:MAG: hypothetical protein NTX61_03295 [Bacteroidetes bacterium]|nr:hypothetical protein [Bacteroidota bacterium]
MKKLYLFIVLIFALEQSYGQLTGTKTIPGTYPTIAAAITDLNLQGVGTGGVTFNVTAGYTETASNLMITATGTSANPVLFQRTGGGANPLITAAAGVSATLDGIIIFKGSDYITFNGIDLVDPVTNNTATTQMEWGYALLKNSAIDGCQHVTLSNCVITLQRIYSGSTGIYVANHTPSSVTALTITSLSGTNSYNAFYSNMIQNVNTGISLTGFIDVTPYTFYDQNNDIGDSGSGTGNAIQDFGGIAATTANGIIVNYQNGCNISYNIISNTSGGGIVSASNIYGIQFGTAVNSSVTINNNMITLNQGNNIGRVYHIYSALSGTGSLTINGNAFASTITSGASGIVSCIYIAGATASSTINNNQFISCPGLNTTAIIYFIYNNVTTPNITVSGNILNNLSKTGAGNAFYGYYNNSNAGGGNENIYGNTFSNITITGATAFYGIYSATTSITQNKSINNNTISAIIGGSTTIMGIYSTAGNNSNIYGNAVYNITSGNGGTGTGAMYAYNISSPTSILSTIFSNTAYGLTNANSGAVYGLNVLGGTTINIYKNSIYTLSGSNAGTLSYGIFITTGTTINIYNNFISDIKATAATGANAVNGLYFAGGSVIGVYFNSIFLSAGSSSVTTFGSSGIYANTTPTLELRDNIVVNVSTAGPTGGYTVAYRRSSTTLTTYSTLSNNNDFYAGTPGTSYLLFYDGTTSIQTLSALKTFMVSREGQSISENPPFVNSAIAPFDLHLKTTFATSCESGGATVSTPVNITTDYDGQSRYPNSGYPNNPSYPAGAPDIGADEFAGMLWDINPPMIIYTPLGNTSSTSPRQLNVTITDASGVPVTGIGLPVLYWKINSGTWTSCQGTYYINNIYYFIFGAGAGPGDVVSYYIVAQDNSTPTPLVGSNPSLGASGFTFNPPAASTPPTTPSTYTILGYLCGSYNVGIGQTYTTLTAAIADLNTKEVPCAVTFVLTDNTYPSETFPITINPNSGSTSANTITIQSAAGKTPVITGSSASGILILNGIDYLIIDGSNSGGADKSLTFENSNTAANTYVIGFSNSGGSDPAQNNTIKNCIIKASSQITNNTYGIFMNATGGGYDNTVITNNTIYSARNGIQFYGSTLHLTSNGQITNNIIGSATDATAIQYRGLLLQNVNNTLISGNEIMGAPAGNANSYQAGIYIQANTLNSKIRKNKIHDWFFSGTGGYSAYGIYFGSDASTLTEISNNLIYLIKGDGWPGVQSDNPAGIYIANGGNCQIYFNSIFMSGNTLSSITAGGNGSCISIVAGTSVLDIRDNILKNSMQGVSGTPADFTYAIYSSSPSSVFSLSNFNDYYVDGVGPNIGYINSTSLSSLLAWQGATGQDANSLNIDPAFTSTSDLHTSILGLNNQGVTIAGISYDYTGTTRTSPPDMGAYEFFYAANMVTNPATAITTTTATLNGTVGAQNEIVVTYFDYGLTAAYDSYIAATPSPVTGTTVTAISGGLTGLTPNTTYHFRAKGIVGSYAYFGLDETFTTGFAPPVVVTTSATGITTTDATLNGTVNANNAVSTVTFEYGLTTSYGTSVSGVPGTVNGSTATAVSSAITGLQICTTYHFRAVAVNASGTTYGNDMTFTTIGVVPVAAGVITGPVNVCRTIGGYVYSVPAITGATGYAWTLPPNATITSGANTNSITVTYDVTSTSGNVTVAGTNNCGSGTASSLAVTVHPLPTVTITGPANACIGSTGNIYTTQAGMSNYLWTVSTGGTITGGGTTLSNTVTVTWTTTGAKTVSVNYTDANGCTAASPTIYNVTVNALPVPTLSGPNPVCQNSTGNVYTTETGMTNYSWSVSAGGSITAGGTTSSNTVTVTWTTSGARTVSVNYYNAANCAAAAPTVYNVTVNALPVPTIAGPAPVCVNSTGNVYTTQAGMTGYSWSVSAGGTITGGGTSISNTITITWLTTGANTVSVNYTNSNGCQAATPTVYNVTVNALPTPTLAGPATVCVNSAGNVYSTQAGMTNYIWSVSSGGTITAGGTTLSNTVTVTWTTTGSKTVSINYTNSNGCTAPSATVYPVTVNALPVPTITGPNSVCQNSTGNNYTTETGMTNYVWTVSAGGTITAGGTATSTLVTVTWNTVGAQTVSVSYTNGNGCTAATPTVYNVSVNALPAPTISGPAAVCANSTGNIYSTQAGMTNYSWVVSSGGTITLGGGTTNSFVVVTWTTAGARTVSVNYTNGNGCTAASPTVKNVTVYALPLPTISGLTTLCAGTTGVTYTTETGMTNYTWLVSSGGTITAGGTTSSSSVTVTWNTAGAQTVSINYTNTNGCTAASPTVYNVVVNALPVPAITGPTPVCLNSTGNVYTTQTGMTNYLWSVSAGGTITAGGTLTSSTATVTWITAGAQTVSVNYANSNNCTAASPTVYNVTVNTLPTPVIAGSASVCAGSTSNVYTTAPGMSNYTWTVSSGGTITGGGTTVSNTVTVTWNTPGAQTVSVNYTNANGCTGASATVKNVTVNALPSPTLTGSAAVCAGTTGVVYTTETGMSNYSWSVSAGGTITAGGTNVSSSVTVTWNTPGAQTVSVNYSNVNGCTAVTATVKNVTVNPLPVPTISGFSTTCAIPGVNYYTESGMTGYTWSVSAGGTITAGVGTFLITVTWNTPGPQTISVNYTNANGCTAVSPTVKNITVNALPVPTITGNSPVCAGTTGSVYTTESGMTNYTWVVSAGGTITSGGTSTSNSVTITWNTAGAQTVTVNYTNSNNCSAATATVKAVTVDAAPVPTINGSLFVCSGATVSYKTEAGMSGYIWTVSAGGSILSGAGTDSIAVLWNTPGTQFVTVNYMGSNGCSASSPTTVNVMVYTLPVPSITGYSSVCVGTTGVIYITEAGMTNYTWSVSGGGLITGGQGTRTAMVAWTAAGPQTISITYTNSNNCTPAAPTVKNVTVNPLPLPTITGTDTLCIGTTGVVYTTEPGMSNYIWTKSSGGTITSGGTSTSNTVTITWNTAGSQYVAVKYTNSNGCTAGIPTILAIIVNPLPVPTISGSNKVCAGSTGIIYTTQGGMTNYDWKLSTGGTITAGGTTTDSTVTITWNTAGSQWITVNYTNPNGCSATSPFSFIVTVNPLPVPTLTGPASVCVGTASNVYTTQTGMTNYQWNVSAGGTITAGGTPIKNTVTVTWTTVGSQAVSVNYTNANGCTANLPTVKTVTVNALPVPVITGSSSLCSGVSGTYITQTGMTSYTWTVAAGGIIMAGGTSASPYISVKWTATGSKWVSVNYTNTSGCRASLSSQFAITVNALPVPTITGSASACQGPNAVIYSTQAGMTNYIWTISSGGTITSGQGTASITVTWNVAGTQWVKVNYTNANGCTAITAAQFNVTVIAIPVPSITGPATACSGTTCYYYTESGKTNYVWTVSPGGTIIAGSGTKSIYVTWSSPGTRTVSVIYNNPTGCPVLNPTVKSVVINPVPAPTITGPTTVCVGSYVSYYTEAGMTNYTWTLGGSGGSIYSGFNGRQILVRWTIAGPKTVNVNYTNAGGCRAPVPASLSVTVNACASLPEGIEDQQLTRDFRIYPNPNQGQFTVSMECYCDENCDLFVFNTFGQKIYELKNLVINGKKEQTIDLGNLPDGLYSVVFRNRDQWLVKKLLIYR